MCYVECLNLGILRLINEERTLSNVMGKEAFTIEVYIEPSAFAAA